MQAFLIYVVLVVSHKVLGAELSSINFLLNGGYYADYASIMGTMGLPVMHHTTWDIIQNVGRVPIGRVHHLVQRGACWMNFCVRSSLKDII